MTTSGPAGKPAGRHAAGPAMSAGIGDHAEDAPDDEVSRAGRQADAEMRSPDDVQELQQKIEQTREQLGETVEQLAAKADVKARARGKAAELTSQVKGKAGQAQAQAAARLGEVRDQLASKTEGTGQKAMSLGAAAKDQLSGRVAAVSTPVWEATPVRRAAAKGASSAGQRRAALAVAAGVFVAGYLAIRWWRRR
jgi:hypothetical protein